MKKYASLIGALLFAGFIAVNGCSRGNGVLDSNEGLATEVPSLFKANRGGAIWADGELFGTVGTPAHFKPGNGPFDELYNVAPAGATFKNGVTAISESKPGDQDFNGGRWHVNILKEGVPTEKYSNACRVEDLDLTDFVGTGTYFECPLLPRRGNN